MTRFQEELQHHLRLLHGLGLHSIPGWGGGKLLAGTDPRSLALDPPSLADQLTADYSGGLIILCGTESPFGGYVTAIDVDRGPEVWSMRLAGGGTIQTWPQGFLYAELGTRNHKSHVFVRTTDRFEGVINLRDRRCTPCELKKAHMAHLLDRETIAHTDDVCNVCGLTKKQFTHQTHGDLVAEIKGLNLSLRSWPSLPEDKPRGYAPLAFALNPVAEPPAFTAAQMAEGLADYLSVVIGRPVRVETRRALSHSQAVTVTGELATAIENAFASLDIELSDPNSSGWQKARCPLHEDRKASFSINLQSGGWICRAGCGQGYLPSLARRIGLRVHTGPRRGHHGAVLTPNVVARG